MGYRILGVILLSCMFYSCQEPGADVARGFVLPEGDAPTGQQAFVDLKCYTCHEVEGLEEVFPRPVARPLTEVKLGGLAMREPTDGELVTSIVNPSHALYPAGEEERITTGDESRMANYNDVITAQQIIDLVAFLHERYETAEPE